MLEGMNDPLQRLYAAVIAAQFADPEHSRTARLLQAGRAKMAKKVAEEAIEVVLDAMHGSREAVVRESADLMYNLVVLWVASGIRPEAVWQEMERREAMYGIAEKLTKSAEPKTTEAKTTEAKNTEPKNAEPKTRPNVAEARPIRKRRQVAGH